MLYIVTGGAGSGKSEYAEKLAGELFDVQRKSDSSGKKIYLATMHYDPKDEEDMRRIMRHRVLRSGKGFLTEEQETNVDRIEAAESDVVLLEDFSNLTANTIFSEGSSADAAVESVLRLSKKTAALVVVTGEIACDIPNYEESVTQYIAAYTRACASLAENADHVTEVVCGIPLRIK